MAGSRCTYSAVRHATGALYFKSSYVLYLVNCFVGEQFYFLWSPPNPVQYTVYLKLLCPSRCFERGFISQKNNLCSTTRILSKTLLLSMNPARSQRQWMPVWSTSHPTVGETEGVKSPQLGPFYVREDSAFNQARVDHGKKRFPVITIVSNLTNDI